MNYKDWTKEEENFLIKNYKKFGRNFCIEKLNRTLGSVKMKARTMGLLKKDYLPPKEELQELIRLDFNYLKIARYYHRNVYTIKKWLSLYNIDINESVKYSTFHTPNWDKESENFLKENYPKFGTEYCALILKRTKRAISHKAVKLGLKINIEQIIKNNPNHYFNKMDLASSRGISFPCEYLKSQLNERKILFEQEVHLLLHLNRRYRADILLREFGVVIEINGKRHYTDNYRFVLRKYFKERHDLFVRDGWRVFEIPSQLVFKEGFIENLLVLINNKNIKDYPYTPKSVNFNIT